MFVGTLLPFSACKGLLYHLIAMLKCFPKCISQSKSIFEHFSPHYVKIIQNQLRSFIATRVRNVAKVLRRTCAVIKRGRIEKETIFLSLGETFSWKQTIFFPTTRFEWARNDRENCYALKHSKFNVTQCVTYSLTGFERSGLWMKCSYFHLRLSGKLQPR